MGLRRNKETLWVLESDLKRKNWIKYTLTRFIFYSIKNNKFLNKECRILSRLRNQKIKSYRSLTFMNNRCLLSGRGYSINSKYKLSRFKFRDNYNNLMISGVKRASW